MGFMSGREIKIFLSFFLVYLLFANIVGWNENSRIFLTASMVDSGRIDIDSYANFTGDRASYNGHYYTDKAPGSSVAGIPAYLAYRLMFGKLSHEVLTSQGSSYYTLIFLFDIISALFSAAGVILMLRILQLYTDSGRRLFIGITAYGLCTLVFSQSTVYSGHVQALFFFLLGFYLLNSTGRHRFIASGLALGAMVTMDYLAAGLVPLLIIYAMAKNRTWKLPAFAAGIAIPLILLMAYNFAAFSHPLATGYHYLDRSIFSTGWGPLPFFESCDNSLGTLDAGSYFRDMFDRCTYTETSVYDPRFSSIVAWNNSFGDSYYLKKITNGTWMYSGEEITKNGVQNHYMRIVQNGTEEMEGRAYHSYLVYHLDGEGQGDIAERRLVSDRTVTVLYAHGESRLVDACLYENPGNESLFINAGTSGRCNITITTKSGRPYWNIDVTKASNVSEEEGRLVSTARITLTYPDLGTLWAGKKIVMLLFYPFRGLFFYSPILLLSIFGLMPLFRKRHLDAILAVSILALYLIGVSRLFSWWGGASYGPRFLVYCIPLLIVALVHSLERRWLVMALLVLSLFINLLGSQSLIETQNMYVFKGGRMYTNSTYYEEMSRTGYLYSPVTSYYLPRFLQRGPSNIVLSRSFGIDFGFANVLFFGLIVAYIGMTMRKGMAEGNKGRGR